MPDETNTNNRIKRELQLDNVLSTQPELGPSIPDGGYGWIIFLVSIFYYIVIPSLSVGFGVIMLFTRIELSSLSSQILWDNKFIFVPLFHSLFKSLTDAIIFRIIQDDKGNFNVSFSTWPRLITISGTCLICASLLIAWKGIVNGYNVAYFTISGIVSGIGTSTVLTQVDVLISLYFRLKLRSVRVILRLAAAVGFMITPIVLGNHIVKTGILHVLIWYQAIILQGLIGSMTFKKPSYLKSKTKSYKIIQNLSDDEEDVFANRTNKATSIPNNTQLAECSTSSQNNYDQTMNSRDDRNQNETVETRRENWETFEDDESKRRSKVKVNLEETFSTSNIETISNTNETTSTQPRPLYDDNHTTNTNNTYSYGEAPAGIVFEFSDSSFAISNETYYDKKWFDDLKELTFYKSLLQVVTTKFSTFIFWSLFPSYLHDKVQHMKLEETTLLVGSALGVAVFTFTVISAIINRSDFKHRALCWWIFSWAGATGYLMICNSENESTLLLGAINVILSLCVLQELDTFLFKMNATCYKNYTHFLLNFITGLCFTIFLILDLRYSSCFYLISLLEFLTGSIWLSNFIFKKIKKIKLSRSS